MLESEREAKRLQPDPSSWSQRRLKQKAYRSMALRPEEEVPPHKSRKKKKHVHKWGAWKEEGRETRRNWVRGSSGNYKRGHPYVAVKWVRVCKGCGYREPGISRIGGPIHKGRYVYNL